MLMVACARRMRGLTRTLLPLACRLQAPPPSPRRSKVSAHNFCHICTHTIHHAFNPHPSARAAAALSLEDEELLRRYYEDKIQQICRSERAKDASRFTDRVMVRVSPSHPLCPRATPCAII